MGSPFTTGQYRERPTRGRGQLVAQVAAAAVLVVVVVVLVVVLLTRGGSDPAPSAGGTTAPTATATPSAGQTSSSTAPGAAQYATAPPVSVSFSDVGGLQLPFSPVDGPTRVSGPTAAGYSHTPQGAALAAVQIGSRLVYLPGYAQVVAAQSTQTPALQAQFIATRDGRAQLTSDDLRSLVPTSTGFQVVSYSPDRAVIKVLTPHPSTNDYRAGSVFVEWSDGDWKFADNSASTSETVANADGFTPWS